MSSLSNLSTVSTNPSIPVTDVFMGSTKLADNTHITESFRKAGYKSALDIFSKAKENYFTHGDDKAFFKIPGCSDYILSISNDTTLWKDLEKQPAAQYFKNLYFKQDNPYPGFKMGQGIASLGDIKIHPLIPGFPNGVSEGKLGLHDMKQYRAYETEAYNVYRKNIKAVSELPQATYTNLAKFLLKLETARPLINFDSTANNIMVDTIQKRLTVIDPQTEAEATKYHTKGNHLAGMTAAMLDSSWNFIQRERFTGKGSIAELDPEFQALRKTVLKKCLIAAHESGLSPKKNPYTQQSPMHVTHDLAFAFRIAGLNLDVCENALKQVGTSKFFSTIKQYF